MKESDKIELYEAVRLKCHSGYSAIKWNRPWTTPGNSRGYSLCTTGNHFLNAKHHPEIAKKLKFVYK